MRKTENNILNCLKNVLGYMFFLIFLSGCLVSEENNNILSKIGDSTCLSAEPFSFDGVLVRFSIPDSALEFRINRDGEPIFNTSDTAVTQQVDKDLLPGQTYRYKCEVLLDRNIGFQAVGPELVAQLQANQAPDFDGIKSITLVSPSSVNLEWSLTDGAIISHYKIFKHIGVAADKSDFSSVPDVQVDDLFAVSQVIQNLGDEITYSFRVVACNSSNICDDNDAIGTVAMPDTGAPQTSGAFSLSQEDGNVVLTAPWSDQNGFVAKRTVFRAATTLGAACPGFGSFAELNSVLIADPKNTPQTIQASGVLNEGSRYCFIVRDTDPTGNVTTNTNALFVDIFDITPPDFISAVTLENDIANPETVLKASWTAMARQIDEPLAGASHYDVYISSTVHDGTPDADPCATGILFSSVPSDAFVQGSTVEVLISGLQPRDKHRVCVRARDTFNNLSAQRPNAVLNTGDVTAPSFAGIQSAAVNTGLSRVDISFVVPPDSDVRNYKITTIRTRNSVVNTPIEIIKTFGALTPGATQFTSFTFNEASLIDNDSVTIRIDACDDASPAFNSSDNCTATLADQTLTLPDVTPPPNFAGVNSAVPGVSHRSLSVSWSFPLDRSDYAGIKVFFVDDLGNLVGINSTSCICDGNDCENNPKTTCTVDRRDDGQFLLPSKSYEVYIRAFDTEGNTTTYLEHTGPSKVTAFGTAADIVAPSFNASIDMSLVSAEAVILFSEATDDQDPDLEIEYELYKKTGTTFTCPLTPFESAGGCDNLTPVSVTLESNLGSESGRSKLVDAAVVDGETYFYQLCAVDDADNRTCQAGSIGELVIEDVTPPVVTNALSDKTFGGGGSWTISFDVSDNIVAEDDLIIKVFKSSVDFPDQSNPGTPAFEKAAATVTLVGSTASFTDTGTPDVPSVFYLIQVQDLNGNRTFVEIRDMPPEPVITEMIWPDPLFADGEPYVVTNGRYTPGNPNFIIRGTNLEQIVLINDVSMNPGNDGRACHTDRIVSKTDTEIVCTVASVFYTDIDIRVQDRHNRPFQTFNAGFHPRYCEYAAANGITELRGQGTSSRPYALCTADHVMQIGRNADNPHNSEDIIGEFIVDVDIDFSGVSNFTGLVISNPDDVHIQGFSSSNEPSILNLSIDTSATNDDAAFIKSCSGSTLSTGSLLRNLQFRNAHIQTGTGRGAVVMVESSCQYPVNTEVFYNIEIYDSLVESNNTAGIIAAEYTTNGDEMTILRVYNSTIKSTRPDSTTAVGGIFGKLHSAASTNTPKFDELDAYSISLLPADGQTEAGSNIGGLIGEFTGEKIEFETPVISKQSTGGFTTISGAKNNVGGMIGHMKGPVHDVLFDFPFFKQSTVVSPAASGSSNIGALVGHISYDGVTPSTNIDIERFDMEIVDTNGGNHMGGLFGKIDHVDGLDIGPGSSIARIRSSDVLSSGSYVGGLIGELKDSNNVNIVDYKPSSHIVSSTSGDFLGGIIGKVTGGSNINITTCGLASSDYLSANGSHVGGFVGQVDQVTNFSITESAIGNSEVDGGDHVGGLIGSVIDSDNFELIDNYVNPDGSSAVDGASEVGGLIGVLDYSGTATSTGQITRNANFGLVTASTSTNVGGLIGQYVLATTTHNFQFNNSYFRNDHAGGTAVNTNATYTAVNEVEGKTLVELQNPATYNTWDVDGGASLWQTDNPSGTAALKDLTAIGGL